jgi:lipoprotein NlpI/transglutaminase-like putative cysteine protease
MMDHCKGRPWAPAVGRRACHARHARHLSPLASWAACAALAWATTLPAWAQTGTSAQAAAKAPAASPRPAAKPGAFPPGALKAAALPRVSLEPAPAWVLPMAPDDALSAALPAAAVQVLLVDRQTRVEAKGAVRFIHAVRRIHDAAGLQRGAQIELEFDPSHQRLALHQLAVWRGAQRIDKLNLKLVTLLHREKQLERQMVDGRMTASIVLDDLRVGDRVEWSASLIGDNPVFGGRFVDTEWSRSELGPTGLMSLRLLAPVERNIRHRVGDPAVSVSSQTRDGWRETLFRRQQAPQSFYDPQLPASLYLNDQIELSEFASWAEVASWAEQLFAKAMQRTPAVDAVVEDIRRRAPTPAEQVQLALDFVQREVRYFGVEIGANSHQPASAEQVLRQRFGDCKDKSALLATLLAGLGVPATPALVSNYFQQHAASRLPSPLAFDHAIAAVTLDGQTLWLDSTRTQQTGAAAERQPVSLGRGLLARAGTAELSELPAPQQALRSVTVDTFDFPKLSQPGRLSSVTTFHGELAEWIRDAKANMPAADFEKALLGDVLRVYPSLTQSGPAELEELPGRNALQLTLRFDTGEFWRFPEQRTLVGDFALISLVPPLRLPDQNPRSQPLRLSAPGIYRHSVRFQFGEEVYAQASNSRFDEVNPRFELHLRYDSGPREQRIEGELLQRGEVLEAADWTRHRDALNKVWPRLANVLNVPALSPAQFDKLKLEQAALAESGRAGKLNLVTREQFLARSRLLLLEQQLAADRLTPKLRAEALLAQGVQLDHLGRSKEAQAAMMQSLALDGSPAAVHAALAVNALLQTQDADAVKHAEQALKLAPSDVAPRYTRAWARYFSGDWAAARDELKSVLQSPAEVDRSYGTIWLYLASRRLGEDGVSEIAALQPSVSHREWPYPVLQLMSGHQTLDGALAASRDGGQPDRGRECELFFYAAQKALLDGDNARARLYLERSLATGVVEFNEYAMARRELQRLK